MIHIPFWFVVLAMLGGFVGLLICALSHRADLEMHVSVRIDDDFAEQLRKAEVDRRFQAHGGKLLRADFNRSFK